MQKRHVRTVYLLLILAWMLIVLWQIMEHHKVSGLAYRALQTRSRDIALSLGVVLKSQERFAAVLRPRLQTALQELVKLSDLRAVALQSPSGEIVAAAGEEFSEDEQRLPIGTVIRGKDTVLVVELMELGKIERTGVEDLDKIVVFDGLPYRPRTRERPDGERPPDVEGDQSGEHERPPMLEIGREEAERAAIERLIMSRLVPFRRRGHPRSEQMSDEDFSELMQKFVRERGIHRFTLKLSTTDMNQEIQRDKWLRIGMALVALLAFLGLGLGWRSVQHSNSLQIRLVRTEEINNHLAEMNLAAAGLAHETRNPLTVVRGLAQMISRQPGDLEYVRCKAEYVVNEVDRITNSLNEFIEYSRPRRPKLTPVSVLRVTEEVGQALRTDMEDKHITFSTVGNDIPISADEGLFRQLLFNLVLNAVQAVPDGSTIEITLQDLDNGEIALTVADNGDGVPLEAQAQLFRPYFSLNENGTGLGLAIVRQIALAHKWDIVYHDADGGGARFRIIGMRCSDAARENPKID